MTYYMIAGLIGLAFLVHLLLLLMMELRRDNLYNQNICINGGRVIGGLSLSGSQKLINVISGDLETVFSGPPRPQITEAFVRVWIRIVDLKQGEYVDYPIERQLVIGRQGIREDVDIALADSMVSALHCLIYRQGKYFYIQDLKATNHTYLNGCMLEGAMPLSHGDMITVGRTVLQFQCFM